MTGPVWEDLLDGAALLSLWQPWATAVADGAKSVETRAYSTRHRGWLLIHAAQHRLTRRERSTLPLEVLDYGIGRTLPLGAVVAVVELLDVVPTADITWDPGPCLLPWRHTATGVRVTEDERPWGGYDAGRYGYLLTQRHPLARPVPALGHQGAPRPAAPTVIAAVAAQLQEPIP